MSAAAASQTVTNAGCIKGTTLTGGGILQDKIDGSPPINGLRMHGTAPLGSNGKPAANGAKNPTSWTAIGGFGGQAETGDQVLGFAMCVAGGSFESTFVVSKTKSGPTAAGTVLRVTVACPTGSRLIGGGSSTNPASTPSLKPIGSYPSTAAGAPLQNGAVDPRSWTAVGAAGGMKFGTGHPSTTAYALCAKTAAIHIVVARNVDVDHPAGPGNLNPGSDPFAFVTATCSRGTELLGGGAFEYGNKAGLDNGVPQWGVHLRGSYPSDAKGHELGEGATDPSSWTALVQSGGQPTPGTDSYAFALCAT